MAALTGMGAAAEEAISAVVAVLLFGPIVVPVVVGAPRGLFLKLWTPSIRMEPGRPQETLAKATAAEEAEIDAPSCPEALRAITRGLRVTFLSLGTHSNQRTELSK